MKGQINMTTNEKMIAEVHLIGTNENLEKFASAIPSYLQSEWTISYEPNINYCYIGDKFPTFRVCLLVLDGKYTLRYVIPTCEEFSNFGKDAPIYMNYFLNKFRRFAADCNISYEIIYEESDGE